MKKEFNNRKLYNILKIANLSLLMTDKKPLCYPHELLIDDNLHEEKYQIFHSSKERHKAIKYYIMKNYLSFLKEEKEFTVDNIFLFISRIKNKQIKRDSYSNKESYQHTIIRYSINEELLKQLEKMDAKDKWADKIWKLRGKPNFNKRIIDGVRYGKGFIVTNNKTRFNRIIIRRYLGVEIVNNKVVINCPD